jgi:hypothetical protein
LDSCENAKRPCGIDKFSNGSKNLNEVISRV